MDLVLGRPDCNRRQLKQGREKGLGPGHSRISDHLVSEMNAQRLSGIESFGTGQDPQSAPTPHMGHQPAGATPSRRYPQASVYKVNPSGFGEHPVVARRSKLGSTANRGPVEGRHAHHRQSQQAFQHRSHC